MRILLLDPVCSTLPENLSHFKKSFAHQLEKFNESEGTSEELEFVLLQAGNAKQTGNLGTFLFYDESIIDNLDEFMSENNIDGIYMNCILTANDMEVERLTDSVLYPDSLAVAIHQKFAHKMPIGIEFNDETYGDYMDSEFYEYCEDETNAFRPYIGVSRSLFYPNASDFKGFYNHFYKYLQQINEKTIEKQKELKITQKK